jgi:hypothetical protein
MQPWTSASTRAGCERLGAVFPKIDGVSPTFLSDFPKKKPGIDPGQVAEDKRTITLLSEDQEKDAMLPR